MIIVAQVSFPRESVNQAVKVYVGLEGLPGGVEKTGPFSSQDLIGFGP